MGNPMLHYYFAKDILINLDQKYRDQMLATDYRIFLFASFFDLGNYYKYANLSRKDPFDISSRLHYKLNPERFFKEAIKYTKENGYSKEKIFLIYMFAENYLFDLYLAPKLLNSHIKDYAKKLDIVFAKKKDNIELNHTNLVKRFKGAWLLNFDDIDMIDYLMNRVFFFSQGEKYFRISLKKYKLCLRIMYKKNLKDNNLDAYYSSFESIYYNALAEAEIFIKAINDLLYLGNDKKLTEFFNSKKI